MQSEDVKGVRPDDQSGPFEFEFMPIEQQLLNELLDGTSPEMNALLEETMVAGAVNIGVMGAAARMNNNAAGYVWLKQIAKILRTRITEIETELREKVIRKRA